MVRVGISLSSSLTAERPAQAAGRMVERAAAAYEAGFHSLSVGDHHAQRGWYQQNTPTLGRLLAEWPDRPAGCLFLLPLWSPVLVAEHVGTLAAHVQAPFIVQVGIGSGRGQFASFGADLSTRGRVTDEAIRMIQGLLAGDTVESERLGVGPTSIGLRPEGEVEWWIGGHAEATLRRAATVGTAWYGGPGLDLEQSRELIERYRTACAGAGSAPRAIARRDAHVGRQRAVALDRAGQMVADGYRGLDLDRLLVGDEDDAVRQLEALGEVGYEDVIIRCMSQDQAEALTTIELLGRAAARVGG